MLSSFLHQKVLPAITFSTVDEALPAAEAVVKGGLQVMEIAFRTVAAPDAISAIRKRFPEITVGAGTLLSLPQLRQAVDAGAQFGLSPGFNPAITGEAKRIGFPFIPGVMTPSEIELACEAGHNVLKLFPAAQVGGVDFLKALEAPYVQLGLGFIPMGGVYLQNMHQFVSLKNVIAVGGSWLATRELIAQGQWTVIEKNVREALQKINQSSL
ncbi:MAG: bifunctional 4-hydroxy-2-oxoglutarate aldolase/2-dehydro-3-deoxy-phosphogluconate aldolase [Chitinophagaceae bacterium]|nr:bifunctional 4-hydroxy-2-oxoglutarate aldolase/2-dehydro-3-deoxy-phosphogluconate aldolase [Chitinophagaceae bacterium]